MNRPTVSGYIREKTRYRRTARYLSLCAVFLAVTLFYVIMLAKTQLEGPLTEKSDGSVAYTRTVSVSGLRGEIYDRNGVLLVGNSTSYDLVLEYGAIPDTTAELNRALIAALDAIKKTGNEDKLSLGAYAFDGAYPDLSFTEESTTNGTEEYQALRRILDANSLDPDNTSPEMLVETLVNKYKLFSDLYTNEEINELLKVRYAMERVKFGAYQPLTVATNIGVDLVSRVEELNIEGVNVKVNSERRYEYPGYASHILGRLGKISAENVEYYSELGYPMDAYVGTSGCEEAFEAYLHGQDGVMEISYDADGNVIKKEFIKEPISGNDVYLTIDIEMQISAEDSLKNSIESLTYSNAGAALAMTPDGEILALASYPTYDLSRFNSVEYYNSLLENTANPLLNRALLGQYAPGSVYKIGSALAALKNNEIAATTLLNCSGTYNKKDANGNKKYPHLHSPTCLGIHGDINVVEAIGVSCNCFFYELGRRMGTDSITEYTEPLGLGVPTGIEISERTGIVAGTAYREANGLSWSQGDDLSAVIGQSDHTYTPLQLGVYISSVLNGGTRYSAHLLHSVKKFYTEETVYQYSPTVLDSSVNISALNLSTLKSGMRRVITASPTLTSYFSSLGVTVGGKTGTAQVSGKKDYAVFAGFAPFDSPEIVSICILEQGVNGGNAAIPVRDIFKAYFAQKSSDDK